MSLSFLWNMESVSVFLKMGDSGGADYMPFAIASEKGLLFGVTLSIPSVLCIDSYDRVEFITIL